MVCRSELVNTAWSIQGHPFISILRVLDLQHYDMVIGWTG
jgi:hypothetical protein